MATSRPSLARRGVRLLAAALVRIYYRGVRVEHGERIPAEGPVVLVSNHPNSILDAAVLLLAVPRPVRFAAASPLFRIPVLGALLRALGAVPIERPTDEGADLRRTVDSLGRLVEAVRAGDAVALFPEGRTHTAPRLEAVRSGPARVAVDAEESAGWTLGLRVVPVGLAFHPRQAFRGEVVVRVGEPFAVADLRAEHRRHAVRTVQERIAASLRPLVHHLDDVTMAALVDRLAALQAEAQHTLAAAPREAAVHALGAALNECSSADPRAVQDLRRSVERVDRIAGRAGVSGEAVRFRERPARAFAAFVLTALRLVIGFPIYVAGLLTCYAPWVLTSLFAARKAGRAGAATLPLYRIVWGIVFFGAYWGTLAVLFHAWSESVPNTVAFVAASAVCGLLAHAYAARARRWEERLEALVPYAFRRRAVARVAAHRAETLALAAAIVERHGPPGAAAAWSEGDVRPIRRTPWVAAAAVLLTAALAWFAAGLRGTGMAAISSAPSPWGRMADADAEHALQRDAAGLSSCLDSLDALSARAVQFRAGFAAGALDFHDPETDTAIRQSLLSYITCRERLLRMVWFYRSGRSSGDASQDARGSLLAYAAAVELCARGMEFIDSFGDAPEAVAKLNEGEPRWGVPPGVFDRVRRHLADGEVLDALAAATARFEQGLGTGAFPRGDPWDRIVARAARGREIVRALSERLWSYRWDAAVARAVHRADAERYAASAVVSTWIGDTRIRERPDDHGLVSPAQLEAFRARLEPGDIVLERRNWYLSNAFLPGYWPHATLWLGGAEGVRSLGIADDPRVAPHLREFAKPDRHGRTPSVIEAISEGVVLTSLEESLGGADALVALRPRLPREAKAEAVARAMHNLGKPYDFDFDFFSTDRLVCTELVYQAYQPVLHFELVDVVGRRTLPAIEIVRIWDRGRGRDDARLDLVAFLDADETSEVVREGTPAELHQTLDRPGTTLLQTGEDRVPVVVSPVTAALAALCVAAFVASRRTAAATSTSR